MAEKRGGGLVQNAEAGEADKEHGSQELRLSSWQEDFPVDSLLGQGGQGGGREQTWCQVLPVFHPHSAITILD